MIERLIPQRNSELIRDRIGQILVLEFTNQLEKYYSTDCDLTVYVERRKQISESELGFVNVSLIKADSSNKHQGSKDDTCQYAIDVIIKGKSTDLLEGDSEAQVKMQRVCGIIDYILEDPIYKTLSFNPPFLSQTYVSNKTYFEQDPEQTSNIAMGRILFNVRVNESNSLLTGTLAAEVFSGIKISNTELGFKVDWQA